MSNIASLIEITSVPHGEAPESVRRGWVGCVMPCEPECGHIPAYLEGVLDKSKELQKIDGFSVPQDVALQVLACHAPLAAKWFHHHGYPKKGKCFRFKLVETKVVRTLSIEEKMRAGKMVVYDDMETGTMRPVP